MPQYKELRKKRLSDVKWAADKLVVDGKITEVKKDTVKDINIDTTERAMKMTVKRSVPRSTQGSSFRGTKVDISSTDDVISALHAIYADHRAARATHNIYAYRIKSGDRSIEHYEDDGEFGAGRKLLDLLQSNDVINQLVVVSRWDGGQHLGPSRYGHIVSAARDVLGL